MPPTLTRVYAFFTRRNCDRIHLVFRGLTIGRDPRALIIPDTPNLLDIEDHRGAESADMNSATWKHGPLSFYYKIEMDCTVCKVVTLWLEFENVCDDERGGMNFKREQMLFSITDN